MSDTAGRVSHSGVCECHWRNSLEHYCFSILHASLTVQCVAQVIVYCLH